MTPRYWQSAVPEQCQIRERKIENAFVDGKIPGMHSWAIMHPDTFKEFGGIYGPGSAQLYEKQSDNQWLKTKG